MSSHRIASNEACRSEWHEQKEVSRRSRRGFCRTSRWLQHCRPQGPLRSLTCLSESCQFLCMHAREQLHACLPAHAPARDQARVRASKCHVALKTSSEGFLLRVAFLSQFVRLARKGHLLPRTSSKAKATVEPHTTEGCNMIDDSTTSERHQNRNPANVY